MPIFQFPAFVPDSRGNRLQRYVVKRAPSSEERRIYLCGPDEVAVQAEWVLQSRGCRRLGLEPHQRSEWTHRLGTDGPVSADVRGMLDLLTEVVTLQANSPVDAALALDFYKDPDSHYDPMQWANTAAGDLVNRGKYWGSVTARNALAEQLADVINRHPVYRAADVVISVPGHDSTVIGFGQRLAAVVARETDKTFSPTTGRSQERPAMKNREAGEVMDLTNEFIVGPEAQGRVVIVVDDVYRGGDTMRAVALAARRAGAVAVLGLVGARTMRGRG